MKRKTHVIAGEVSLPAVIEGTAVGRDPIISIVSLPPELAAQRARAAPS